MDFINRIFRLKNKDKKVSCYYRAKKVYLLIEVGKKNYYFESLDGFDFKPVLSTKALKKMVLESKPDFGSFTPLLVPGSEYIHPSSIRIEGIVDRKKEGEKMLFYHYQQAGDFQVGLVGLNSENQIIWRHHKPIWQSPANWKDFEVHFLNVFRINNKIISYWYLADKAIYAIVYPDYKISNLIEIKKSNLLHKPDKNPLIAPKSDSDWEAFTTFNPAAIYEADKVHLLYRAQGFDYRSVVGYATSSDGLTVDYRQSYPCFVPTMPFEKGQKGKKFNPIFMSGGGCEGCEDPRITRIDDRIYMTYVAFNGWDPPRIAITSITLTDFLAHRWLWERPVLISPPKIVDKSACILPEKIGGKYVIFHRIFPNILIDFVDSLDFEPGQYLKGQYKITPRAPLWWDSRKIGIAAPPLKTKEGWLLIYQSVDDKDASHYQVGAMLLKLNDPTQVICRSAYPIIEPDMWYDNQGFKAGVVYPCGAVIIKEMLFVYYGGADSHVCVATTPLEPFLKKLIDGEKNLLDPVEIKKI